MSNVHSFGEAVTVLDLTNEDNVCVNKIELDKIFNNVEVINRKLVLLSIIGAFRGGKSFFLDYCLRFLYAHVSILIFLKKISHNSSCSELFSNIYIF